VLQEEYLANLSGACPFFKPGDTFLLERTQWTTSII
jgi:hypothetical protein